MIEIFDMAHVLAKEIHGLNAVGAKVPIEKSARLRKLMDILKDYAVLRGPA